MQSRWATAIPDSEWAAYARALKMMRAAGLDFMVGGGFAFAAYTGRWRDTKDIDLYVRPQDREKAINALHQAGFEDFYDRLPYDRNWIYRGAQSDFIVDIIWSMANQRAHVDELWFKRAPKLTLRGERLSVIPLEELIWCKLYIIQRDRCDWTDIFNLLYARAGQIDWNHLNNRLEADQPLLRALLTVYGWLCPSAALALPRSLWRPFSRQHIGPEVVRHRSMLLDSRAWFSATQPEHRKLEI
ncbi:MAG TPA: nucleotidyltransferase [Candidatus Limnocylindrales bacterium]|nr:nucleotidyltransferase [Candidatus Limnocylindrales bacterium]